MNENKSVPNDWKPCPPGLIPAFAGIEKSRQRIRRVTKFAGVSAAVVLVACISIIGLNLGRRDEPTFGGVTCTTVQSNAPQFMAGKLPPQLADQIRIHLEQCVICQRALREMSPTMNKVSAVRAVEQPEPCGCPACRQHLHDTVEQTPGFARFDFPDSLLATSR